MQSNLVANGKSNEFQIVRDYRKIPADYQKGELVNRHFFSVYDRRYRSTENANNFKEVWDTDRTKILSDTYKKRWSIQPLVTLDSIRLATCHLLEIWSA